MVNGDELNEVQLNILEHNKFYFVDITSIAAVTFY